MCQNAERIELVCRNRICGYVQQTSPGLHYIKGIGVTPKISVLLPETLAKTKNFASFGYFITQMALLRVKGCYDTKHRTLFIAVQSLQHWGMLLSLYPAGPFLANASYCIVSKRMNLSGFT